MPERERKSEGACVEGEDKTRGSGAEGGMDEEEREREREERERVRRE